MSSPESANRRKRGTTVKCICNAHLDLPLKCIATFSMVILLVYCFLSAKRKKNDLLERLFSICVRNHFSSSYLCPRTKPSRIHSLLLHFDTVYTYNFVFSIFIRKLLFIFYCFHFIEYFRLFLAWHTTSSLLYSSFVVALLMTRTYTNTPHLTLQTWQNEVANI